MMRMVKLQAEQRVSVIKPLSRHFYRACSVVCARFVCRLSNKATEQALLPILVDGP